jgi:hypothetical protein
MPRGLWLFVMISSAVALLYLGLQLLVEKLYRRLAARISRQFSPGDIAIMDRVNFVGRRRAGLKQLRGNGVLLLAKEKLCFFMLWPERQLQVPLSAITAVSTSRTFLGKVGLRPFLVIDFIGEEGPDAVAFAAANVSRWISALRGDGKKQ